MSVDITARVHIAREPAAVAAYMTDPANDPRWIGGLREAELLGEPPVGVGSRVRRVAYFLGRSRAPRERLRIGVLALVQSIQPELHALLDHRA